ncbi:saccharopine dehydrogenase [bacterium (candidate division B38) B3_B38]|nr:MAG: saccharopine dehydrogenase [bacterium (candidate division B38) B3_B38]
MKLLVFGGSGKIGPAVAWDLVKENDVEAVGLVGRREHALNEAKKWINSDKVKVHPLDIANREDTIKLMKQYDVGVIALPDRKRSYKVIETAIDAGLNIVDMLEEYHRRPDPYEIEGLEIPGGITLDEYGEWLHKKAIENGVTFLDGIGFAPGLSNITLGEGIRKMDKTESAVARVGGIPSKQAASKHPLKYMITWAFSHVLREYMVKVSVLKNGKVVEVNATSDRESFTFDKFGMNEQLECAVTPGMPSFLFTRPDLKEFAEKTVRWPGHWQGVETLKECGLLDLTPVEHEGIKIAPRDFLLSIIEPRLQALEGDTDVCVMWNTVKGTKDGQKMRIDYYLWDEADTVNGISSMARVTGFSAAIGAVLIGRGEITTKGIVPPEDCIAGELYDKFLKELKKRNIDILETSAKI